MLLKGLLGHFHCILSGHRLLWDEQRLRYGILGRHQGYLSLRVGSPVLKQVASGDRAIGICNTGLKTK